MSLSTRRHRCSYVIIIIVNNVTVTVVTSQELSPSLLRCCHHCRCNCSNHLNGSIVAETVGVIAVTVDIAHRGSVIDASSSLRHCHRRHHHHHYRHSRQRRRHHRIITSSLKSSTFGRLHRCRLNCSHHFNVAIATEAAVVFALNGEGRKNVRFQRKTGHISKTVRDRAKVT